MAMLPPILMLHGWGGSGEATFGRLWQDRLAQAGRDCVLLDLPGHADPAASGDPAAYGDLAGGVAEHLPEGPLDVVAFSLGAKLALELALRMPTRFRRLVLGGVGDNIFAPERAAGDIALALEQGVDETTGAHARAMVRYSEASRSNPRALAAVLRRPPNPVHHAARLAALAVPTLIVNGDADGVARPDTTLFSLSPLIEGRHLTAVNHIDLPADHRFVEMAVEHLSCGDALQSAPAVALSRKG